MNEVFVLIKKIERRNKLIQIVVCIFLAVPAYYMIIYKTIDRLEKWNLFVNTMGAIFGLVALYFFLQALNIVNKKYEVREVLMKESKKIAWVYAYIVQNMPYGIKFFRMATLYVKLSDGRSYTMTMSVKETNQVMDLLKPLLLNTTFGYSEKKAFLYKTNPALLLH